MLKLFSFLRSPIGMGQWSYNLALVAALLSVSPAIGQSVPHATQSVEEAVGGSSSDQSTATPPEEKMTSDVQDAQNPIANVISVPFQNNTYLDYGASKRDANILVIQPVIPIAIGSDWNLVTRWVTPIISLPRGSPLQSDKFGIGNMEPEFYFSPSHVGDIIWGIGPKLWLPTATDRALGLDKWGAGPTAVALTIQGPWVIGVLANNVWAGSGTEQANQLTINPFVNYNLSDGWYISSAELITANWRAKSGQQWTVPLGGGIGRLFHVGSQPINARLEVLNNVVRPQNAPTWQLQFQVQFLFSAK
jgi:hypothetical protein